MMIAKLNFKLTILKIFGSLQAYLFSMTAGNAFHKNHWLSLVSNMTEEIEDEMFKLKIIIVILSLLFFTTIIGTIKGNKWFIFISTLLGIPVVWYSLRLII